jgi:uncharacterized metal-binding protein YceD (DUF177 family)
MYICRPNFNEVERIKAREFQVAFTGLKLGKHQFQFEIDDKFFEHFDYKELFNTAITVDLEIEKRETMLVLQFEYAGKANCVCDRCTDDMFMLLEGEDSIIVKLSDHESDADDEGILFIPTSEYQVDCAPVFYESIVVQLPLKKAHEDEEDCNPEMIAKLEELEGREEVNKEVNVDPRWASLRNLK